MVTQVQLPPFHSMTDRVVLNLVLRIESGARGLSTFQSSSTAPTQQELLHEADQGRRTQEIS